MPIDLISLNECNTIEFKEKVNDNFFKSLSAFANTDGGCILLGVKDDKSIESFINHNFQLFRNQPFAFSSFALELKTKLRFVGLVFP